MGRKSKTAGSKKSKVFEPKLANATSSRVTLAPGLKLKQYQVDSNGRRTLNGSANMLKHMAGRIPCECILQSRQKGLKCQTAE